MRPPTQRLLLQLVVPMQPMGNQLSMPEDGPLPKVGQEMNTKVAKEALRASRHLGKERVNTTSLDQRNEMHEQKEALNQQ